MSKNVTLNPKGLFTNFNSLSQVEPGALLKANNVVLDERGIIKPRRGIKYYSSLFLNLSSRARQLLEYKGRILRHVENKLAFDDGSGLFTEFNGNYQDASNDTRIKGIEYKGNFYITSDSGVKKISSKTVGEISSSSIYDTGAPIAKGILTSLVAETNGILDANQHTAYRVTWGYTDSNNLLIEGVPSAISTAENPTPYGKFSVDCKIYIPNGITTSYFFRLYRCETRATTSSLSTEFRLVFQGNPTSGELAAGYLTYNDNLSEDFRNAGIALYVNPNSGSGEVSANFTPPMATDIALYQNHIFYANTKLKQTKIITLQDIMTFTSGVSNFKVIQGATTRTYTFQGLPEVSTVTCQPFSFYNDGDYFLLNSARNERRYFVYVRKSVTPVIPSPTVQLDVAGRIAIEWDIQGLTTANQVALKLQQTLDALLDFSVINLNQVVSISNAENGDSDAVADGAYNPTHLVFSTFQNGIGEDFTTNKVLLQSNVINSDLQALEITARSLVDCINADALSPVTALYVGNGKLSLFSKVFTDTVFYTDTTDNNIKNSWFPILSSTQNSSDSSKTLNGLYFSKQDQPESVPLVNSLLVGSSDEPILRIVPLRESLFIFKTDGLFRLSGYNSSTFSITLFDSTAILKAPDSAVVLRNQVYFFGTQGVSRVSEGGSDKLSNPIDNKLIPLITTCPNLAKLTFAVGYETDQSYILWTALKSSDSIATIAYRYNLYTDSWVEWNVPKTCAVLNSNEDKLYFGSGSAATLEVERKNFNRFDYVDREMTITLPALSMINNVIKPTGSSQIEAGDVIYQIQGVTIYQLNQVLDMIITDPSTPLVNSFLTFKASPGDSISVKIQALTGYLNSVDTNTFTDSHGNTSYVYSPSSDITIIQNQWFAIVDRINQSPFFFRSNYPKYNRQTPVEALVISRDIANNDIHLNQQYPFLEGDLLLYKAMATEIEFVPQSGGDASSLKQFQSCQVIFQNRSINTAQIGFNSDLSADFEYVNFSLNSSGTWGNFEWGNGCVWGGEGDKAPLRTYVPARKQRCRFIGLRFKHIGALESFNLYGLALSYNDNSDRAYK